METQNRMRSMTGEELRKLRTDAGLTQAELARQLGYTVKGEPNKSQISRFECGYVKINQRIAAAIQHVLTNA